MMNTRNVDWLGLNSQRRYPLTIDATCLDLSGTFRLPDDFIVSLYLPVHWGQNVQSGKFFIQRVASYATGFAITIGYAAASGNVSVASALIARAAHTENQVYNLGGIGDFADSRGTIVIGALDSIDDQPSGQFEFDLAGGRLEPDAIRPQLRGVMSLQLQNGTELSPKLYGHIRLSTGRNFRATAVIEDGLDPVVVLDAISGAGLVEECVCDAGLAEPIRTIDGVGPDGAGNLTLLGSSCIAFEELDHGLLIKDTCSEPCCGCKELEVITSALEAFGDKATTLENFLVGLEAVVSGMEQTVLGSRLGDRGCDPDCP